MAAPTKKPNVSEEVTTNEVKELKAVVTAEKLNVRSRMSLESDIVTVVNKDDKLTVTTTKSVQWHQVSSPVKGFVKSEFIDIV